MDSLSRREAFLAAGSAALVGAGVVLAHEGEKTGSARKPEDVKPAGYANVQTLRVPVEGKRQLCLVSGIAIAPFAGEGDDWRRATLVIDLDPKWYAGRPVEAIASVAPGVFAAGASALVGWGVDSVRTVLQGRAPEVQILAEIAVRQKEATLVRVAFQASVLCQS